MNKKQRKLIKKRQHVQATSSLPLHDKKVHIKAASLLTTQRIPLWTRTGELFQPVRLHYKVSKLRKILKVFNKLRCMNFDSSHECWKWLYTDESGNITFQKKRNNSTNPFVLGAFFMKGKRNMYLDVHSIERALEAISFFDRYFSRRVAKITHLSVVNRLFDPRKAHTFTFNHDFEPASVVEDPITSLLQTFDSLSTRARDENEKMALIEAYLENKIKTLFPEVEHIVVHYYREGIRQPWFVLGSRQYVAIQHWKGNTGYSHADYIREVVQNRGKIPA